MQGVASQPWLVQAPGLSFRLFSEKQGCCASNLERQFAKQHARNGLQVDKLLISGLAGVHLILGLGLLRSGVLPLAILTFAAALMQLGMAALVCKAAAIIRWRHWLYVLNILWMAVYYRLYSSIHNSSPSTVAANHCHSAGGLLFWAAECTNAAVPWMLLNALLFPLPMPLAIPVHAAAVVTLMSADVALCQASLNACPAGAAHFQGLQAWLARSFSVFSTSTGAEPAASAAPLSACVATYALAQAFAFVVALQTVWRCERAARLSFLARTDRYDIEWALERMGEGGAPQMMFVLELAATLALLAFCMQAAVPVALAWLVQ